VKIIGIHSSRCLFSNSTHERILSGKLLLTEIHSESDEGLSYFGGSFYFQRDHDGEILERNSEIADCMQSLQMLREWNRMKRLRNRKGRLKEGVGRL